MYKAHMISIAIFRVSVIYNNLTKIILGHIIYDSDVGAAAGRISAE